MPPRAEKHTLAGDNQGPKGGERRREADSIHGKKQYTAPVLTVHLAGSAGYLEIFTRLAGAPGGALHQVNTQQGGKHS